MDGKLVFRADDGTHGREPWTSDGTGPGTTMVTDLAPGSAASNVSLFTAAGSFMYFVNMDAVAGQELWRTDGTAAGTRLVRDIFAGPASSSPTQGVVVADTLYFGAVDAAGGSHSRATGRRPARC